MNVRELIELLQSVDINKDIVLVPSSGEIVDNVTGIEEGEDRVFISG